MEALTAQAGLHVQAEMAWWNSDLKPSPEFARYQMIFERQGGKSID